MTANQTKRNERQVHTGIPWWWRWWAYRIKFFPMKYNWRVLSSGLFSRFVPLDFGPSFLVLSLSSKKYSKWTKAEATMIVWECRNWATISTSLSIVVVFFRPLRDFKNEMKWTVDCHLSIPAGVQFRLLFFSFAFLFSASLRDEIMLKCTVQNIWRYLGGKNVRSLKKQISKIEKMVAICNVQIEVARHTIALRQYYMRKHTRTCIDFPISTWKKIEHFSLNVHSSIPPFTPHELLWSTQMDAESRPKMTGG